MHRPATPQPGFGSITRFRIHSVFKTEFPLWRADLKICGFVCRIHRIRVDGSHIRKEKVADSKISGYVWTGPQSIYGSVDRLKISCRN